MENVRVSRKLKNIGIVSALTVVSRILGLVRDQLGAAIFGASVINSAFITAFNLPNLFRRLLGEGALTAAFVPTLQTALHEGGQPAAFRLLNRVTTWLAVVCASLVALGALAFSQSRLWGGHEDKWYLAADLTALLFPYLLFVCVAAAFSAALNVFQRFTEPALSPIWLNLTMIASLGGAGLHWADTDLGRAYWLCAGVLVGGFLQMAVPGWVLMRMGWRPRFDFSVDGQVREIARLMAPGIWGTAVYQINIFVSRTLAYSIDDSSATVLFLANRLMELPIGVFAIAVATVVYPLIAKHAAEGKMEAMADDYHKGLRLILLINVPAAVGLALLAEPIVRVLFEHGRFTPADTLSMATLLRWFVVAMPFFSVVSLTSRAFYAVKDTRTPVQAATFSFLVNVALSLLLKGPLGAVGLVIASTMAVVAQILWLQSRLTRLWPALHFGPLWRPLGKVLGASGVLGVAVWLANRALGGVATGSWWGEVLRLACVIPAGALVYLVAARLFRLEDLVELQAALARKLGVSKK